MPKPKVSVNTKINTITDMLTGEIVSQQEEQEVQAYGIPEAEPDFIKLYLNQIAQIQKLPPSAANVLFEIAKRMPYANDEDQEIVLNSYIKQKIAQKLKISEQYVSDTITTLVKKQMLFRCSIENPKTKKISTRTGVYKINPVYIARGKWEDIKKLQLKIDFDIHGKAINSVDIERKDGSIETINALNEAAATGEIVESINQPTATVDQKSLNLK